MQACYSLARDADTFGLQRSRFSTQTDGFEVRREVVVAVVVGPFFGELADLRVGNGRVGAQGQQVIDHRAAAVEGGVMKRGAREVETGRDAVDLCSLVEEVLDRLGVAP